ncbi:MAG: CfrBI family restriction endonuclease [Blastocatellia bacterium]|nr:CfrBI family restriction endonuclease [Blastocatellia bacterium]
MSDEATRPSIIDLFPKGFRVLLTGGGKEFVERAGEEVVREVVLGVMMGKNIRTETEPLTCLRLAQISGGLVALFAKGCLEIDAFTKQLSEMSVEQREKAGRDKGALWLSNWMIGLTGKGVQNVLRSDREAFDEYIVGFEKAMEKAARKCREEIGELRMSLGFAEDRNGQRVELDWEDITRLTTAIGSQTLTIRGSEKSIYGKLFEKLVLGSFLTLLGFEMVDRATNKKTERVFWLSSSTARESDATLLVRPGKLARFDMGFIGPGNSEISKDKLNRYEKQLEIGEGISESTTFIVVDRLPTRSNKTQELAEKIGAEIVQMSMQYWPRDLALRLNERLGIQHELQNMPDSKMGDYLAGRLAAIPILDFLSGVTPSELEDETEAFESEPEVSENGE